jgi:hypothetical protein
MQDRNDARRPWWKTGFVGLHYDLHAKATDTELGAELTPEHLREQLAKVRPDYVQCDCKGHPGYSSYPTRIGSPSPGIVRDALRIHRDVTRELGIPLSVHYSGIWDKRAVELHPDWSARQKDGGLVLDPQGNPGILCPRSPYLKELMIPQLLEIVERYDVDGFWVDGDCWAVRDCYCERCREEFRRRTGIDQPPTDRQQPDWPAWRSFQQASFVEYVDQYARAVHHRKPGCAVCSNWMYSMRHPGPVSVPVDYLSGDFDHSHGAESAEMEGRYIDGHRMPWNLMSWTFTHTHADVPWQSKTAVHLCQEAAEVMSCGGGVFFYSVPRRSGLLTDWQHDILKEAASFCRLRQPFVQGSCSIPEAAVLLSDAYIGHHSPEPFVMGDTYHGASGALHVLMENQYHADVLDETRLKERIAGYSLVVLGEQDPISPGMETVLESYACGGGIVLMSGSHLAGKHPRLTGVVPAGDLRQEEWCMASRHETFALPAPWAPVRPVDGEVYARVMPHRQLTEPPQAGETEYPGVTIRRAGRGAVAAIHGNFMRPYYLCHNPRMRHFIRDLLDALGVRRRVEVAAPPSLEVSLRSKGDVLFVHLVNRAANPTLTPRLYVVEEVPPVSGLQVRLRLDRQPVAVTLEPGGRPLEWSYADGWLSATVPRLEIHDIVSVSAR